MGRQILMHGTWAEQDLNNYLRKYSEGSEWTERRKRTCQLCGDDFDLADGVDLPIYRCSKIRVEGRLPKHFYVCNRCYNNAENIDESED